MASRDPFTDSGKKWAHREGTDLIVFRHRCLNEVMSGLSSTVCIYSGMYLHREEQQWLDQIELLKFL